MSQNQSSLGGKQIHRTPSYHQTKIGRVTSIKDYKKYGKIEVVFLDHGYPFPLWVVGSIDREPVTGDQILVGYMEGRKDAPYMMGFVRNESYTSNFIEVAKDRIRVQLPVMQIGVKNGKAHKDVQGFLQDNTKLKERAYVELTPLKATVHHPIALELKSGDITVNASGSIKFNSPAVSAGGNNLLVDEV